jgi:hypothetical protein
MIDPGNLVKADDTLLTNVVTLDPIHAYFDVDERTELRLRRLVQNKMIDQMVRDKKDDTSEIATPGGQGRSRGRGRLLSHGYHRLHR